MKKPFIVFDFDGTIINTNDIIIASWQATCERYLGHRGDVRVLEATFGETLMYTIERMFPGHSYEEVRDYYRAYQDAHKHEGLVYIFPGVIELMQTLRDRGHRIGVATSRTEYSLMNYMKQFGMVDYVDEIVTMENVSRHKPDPESLELVMEKLGAKPEETIMIGDTKYDIGCAKGAGVDSVLVGWSHYVDETDLEQSGFVPTYRIDKPHELLELV